MRVTVAGDVDGLADALLRGLAKQGHEVVLLAPREKTFDGLRGSDALVTTGEFLYRRRSTARAGWDYLSRLVDAAEQALVPRFVVVSQLPSDSNETAIDNMLRGSRFSTAFIRTSLLFPALGPLVAMARRGWVLQFGCGQKRLTPVHMDDVAEAVASSLRSDMQGLNIGGPDDLTWDEIVGMCGRAAGRSARIFRVPQGLVAGALRGLGLFLPGGYVGCLRLAEAQQQELLAPRVGRRPLQTFLEERAQ